MLSHTPSSDKVSVIVHWCKHRFALTSSLSRLFAIGFTKIVFQQNHFSWNYSHRIIILGTIPCLLLPKAVFWRRCHRQMQERYEVARVKTEGQFGEHHKLDRREIYPVNGSKNIISSTEGRYIRWMVRRTSKIVRRTLTSIWCDSQTKDERKRNGQKRAAISHISGYVLDIYLAMPKRSVAAAPNISHSYILGIFEYFCSEWIRAYFCMKK